MPGCAAVGCNNRSEKGYIMKCFPRDPKLRKIWQERVARADWEPSNNSFLCHVHFEPQQWSITQKGRIRLKKNAIPSIFTVTSTRKSPKKKTKIFNEKGDSILQGEYNSEYMENDTEHSSAEHIEENSLDLQSIEDPSEEKSIKYTRKSLGKVEGRDIKIDHQNRNIIMIAEDNLADISNLLAKPYNFEVQPNDKKEVELSLRTNNSEDPQVPSIIVKEEIKLEVMDHNTFEDSYDEIEEKLKQICDGGSTEDENSKNQGKKKVIIKNPKEDEEKEKEKICTTREFTDVEHKVTSSPKPCHNFSTKGEVEHMLVDKEENVEIIFGTESGDEKMPISQITTTLNKPDNNVLEYDEIICIKDEKKAFNEDIEENFTKDEVHVIPNIRAAMKRKRRTREEIMKSIKKSIRSTSDQDVNSLSNSELSGEEGEVKIRNELSLLSQELNNMNKDGLETGAAKFIIKVTGDPDDVTEIIEELSSNTIGTQISKNEENEAFVTSVITVLSPNNPQKDISTDFSSPVTKDEYTISNKNVLVVNRTVCDEKEFTNVNSARISKECHCFEPTVANEEKEGPHITTKSPLQNCTHGMQVPLESNTECIPSDYEDLLERIQIQEDVIAKLTDQLIIYKELENSLSNKSTVREMQAKEMEAPRVNTRSSNLQSSILKKNLESKQRLVVDLSNRVNYFEEMNKKLMKTVTLESQQKRKLEGQIRQKDNRIKELNWKLEKASKYLERAEKNTNTYRRKMLNMQTIMRRRKLLDEKMSKFNEMLIDSSKEEFSEKVLSMAADIRKACGRNGYDKLLSYGFPLPPLPALRKGAHNEDFTDPNKSDMDDLQNSTVMSVKVEKAHNTNNDSDTEEKNAELSNVVNKTEYEGTETVTGTVQDIFDENNDGDDFSTNELREHFILQLNAVM